MKYSQVIPLAALCSTPGCEKSRPQTAQPNFNGSSAEISHSTDRGRTVPTLVLEISKTKRSARFSVALGSTIIVKCSKQPRSDAARVLFQLGFPDDTLLLSYRKGSNSVSSKGLLGTWRKLRVKEGRNGPEFAAYKPFPCARVEERKAKTESTSKKAQGTQLNAFSRHRVQPKLQEVPPRAFPLATLPPWHQMNRSKRNPALRKPAPETNA